MSQILYVLRKNVLYEKMKSIREELKTVETLRKNTEQLAKTDTQERICSWRFLAVINAQIGFWGRNYGTLNDSDAESIVTLFMHGIFS